jgi:putative membrane protein
LDAIALAFGFLLGAVSGLVPGLHSNTIAPVLAGFFSDPSFLSVAIIAMFASRTALEFFPSIFFGVPDPDVAVSVLPGHRMLLSGRGLEAARVCAISLLISSVLAILLFPVSLWLLPILYSLVEPYMLPILAVACGVLLLTERKVKSIAMAAVVFILAGMLGLLTINSGINDPLFPAFAGLFAIPALLISSDGGSKTPEQEDAALKIDFLPAIAIGVCLGMLADLFPGLASPAQIAVFATLLVKLEDAKNYLALVCAIAASHAIFAFASLLSIGKARVGALAIVNGAQKLAPGDVAVLAGIFFSCLCFGVLLFMFLSKKVLKMPQLEFSRLNPLIISYLVVMAFLMSGLGGLLVLATGTCIGLLPIFWGVRRTHVMGLILVPSMAMLIG